MPFVKKTMAILMASLMSAHIASPILALTPELDEMPLFTHNDKNNSDSNVDVNVLIQNRTTPFIFSAYVPAAITIAVSHDGQVITPENLRIINGVENLPIGVWEVRASSSEGWTMMPWDTSIDNVEWDAKQLAVNINGYDMSAAQNTMDLPWVIDANAELPMKLDAKVPYQSQAKELTRIMTMGFTMDWADRVVKAPKEMVIRHNPTKKDYIEQQNFDPAGMELRIYYDNGTTRAVDNSELTFVDGNNLKANQSTVTCRLIENDTAFETKVPVNVREKIPLNMTIYQNPSQTEYKPGEDFNSSGLRLKVDYDNGFHEIISSGFTVTNGTSMYEGQSSVHVEYVDRGKNFSVDVPVSVRKVPVSLSVYRGPNQTTYNPGQSFNSSGLQLKVTYHDGSSKIISSGFTVPNGNRLYDGQSSVRIQYSEKGGTVSTYVSVSVKKAPTGISVYRNPNQTTYEPGQRFNSSGLQLKVYYNDGTSKIISGGYTITNGNKLYDGQSSVRVEYTDLGKTVSTNVSVTVRKALLSFSIDGSKSGYFVTYNFERGMTWMDFINSSYSHGNFHTVSFNSGEAWVRYKPWHRYVTHHFDDYKFIDARNTISAKTYYLDDRLPDWW